LVATQFESASARKAFPCFDEPRVKASFNLTLETPPGLAVLSNMPPSPDQPSQVTASGRALSVFSRTPPMSTYLLAFTVGALEGKQGPCNDSKSTPVSVWATEGKINQLDVALEAACVAVQTYEAAFNMSYPLPKLDLVALPDFQAGAMENFGCIFFRWEKLLLKADSDSDLDVGSEIAIAATVSHEISHQWFGDLVTMAQWEELWLNEGFASYLEIMGVDAFRPQYGFYQLSYTSMTATALSYDVLPSVHALSAAAPLTSVADIEAMFDDISYEKGGAVLRMVRAFLDGNLLTNG
ncbi:hypothetical protein VOLCADRAFT_31998, partial [Volvox carteri f. nagariensis]